MREVDWLTLYRLCLVYDSLLFVQNHQQPVLMPNEVFPWRGPRKRRRRTKR